MLILSLPLMKPAIAFPVVLADLVFIALVLAIALEVLTGKRRLEWRREYWVLPLYVGCLAPSLLATTDVAQSLSKMVAQIYLAALALVTATLIQNEADLRRAIIAWLVATAIVAAVSIASLAIFPFAPNAALVDYARFHFGTLQPGPYPRLSSTFLNANMACNYLSVSAALVLAARACGWLSPQVSLILFASTVVAALATISAGLGGLALIVGIWLWLRFRDRRPTASRFALTAAIAVAAAFVIALAVTPIPHPTAAFVLTVPGTEIMIAPSARWMLWSASLAEFARHPLIGHGIGIDATFIRYLDPSGNLQIQTDAHNVFLNIAAQSGLIGLVGLAALLAYAFHLTRPWRFDNRLAIVRIAIGLGFLGGFAYQGLGGSFEDARHLWVVLGLLIAARRLSLAGGNSRRAAAPSPC